MTETMNIPTSDAEWYCRKDAEADIYYTLFFRLCRKYHISWPSASEEEKAFIEEVTRVTYERGRAQRLGLPIDKVQPAFAS